MRPLLVVPLHPVPNDPPRLLERLKDMPPDTLFFETAKEPFDDAILCWRIRREERLLQARVPTGLPAPPTLEDQPIGATYDWGTNRAQGAKPLEAGRFDGPLRLLRPTPQGKLVADHRPIMTIGHGRQMGPAVVATGNMRHIHRPPFIAATGPAHPPSHARAGRGDPLMHEPPLLLQHAIQCLAIDHEAIPESQLHPAPAIAERRMSLNPIPQPVYPGRLAPDLPSRRTMRSVQASSAPMQHPTAPSLRDTRHARSHAPEVFRS